MGKVPMNQKKIHSITLAIIMIASCFVAAIPVLAEDGNLHAVKGMLYINGFAAPAGIQIILTFPTEPPLQRTTAWDQGYNYVISFQGHEGQTGEFSIYFQEQYYVPTDNLTVTIIQDVIGYHLDLHITAYGGNNIPPIADAGGPYTAQINIPITFTGAASYDIDGTIAGYRWDWTNDGIYDTSWLTTPTATHSYSTEGGYTVKLQVKDDDGAINNDTAPVTITTTPPTNQPPYTPAAPYPLDLSFNQSIFSDLSWDGGDPDAGDIVFYDIYFGTTNPPLFYGATIGYPAAQTRITYTLPQLLLSITYYWQILSHDNHGASISGPVWRFTTVLAGADTQPPSKVTGLTVTDAQDGKLNLVWNPATDNVGVDHYKIYRDTIFLINRSTTSYQDTGLVNGHTYTYTVMAVDTSGNEGNLSDPASGTPTPSGNGGGGGGEENPLENIFPVADASAGEPYEGYVNQPMTFDGSKSHDPDGHLISWDWSFGDGTSNTGETTTHTYTQAGIYTVVLTVKDNRSATDTDQTTAVVTIPNIAPTTPNITGPNTGQKNTSYDYQVTSTDADNDTIKYIFTWDDGETTTTAFFASGVTVTQAHTWSAAGRYEISVTANDNTTDSGTATLVVLIDAVYVNGDGYLIDTDGDGIYDLFHSNETGAETNVTLQDDGTYLIDTNGDGEPDLIYDPETKETKEPKKEGATDNLPWFILGAILGCIAILSLSMLLLIRKTTPVPPPAAPVESTKSTPTKQSGKKSTKK
jgi:PKD repeat protein